nr:hypothetical protein [Burkholderia gladioli]
MARIVLAPAWYAPGGADGALAATPSQRATEAACDTEKYRLTSPTVRYSNSSVFDRGPSSRSNSPVSRITVTESMP